MSGFMTSCQFYDSSMTIPITKYGRILFTSRMKKLRHFDLKEFDSPDKEGSGVNMDAKLLEMLDDAREIAGVPFKVNSGYRTREHNSHLLAMGYKASPNSSHLKGLAVDISATSTGKRYAIITALLEVGFNRIGIASNFIHVDRDPDKPSNQIWVY